MALKKNCCTKLDPGQYPVTGQFIVEHQILELRAIQFCKDFREGDWDAAHDFCLWQIGHFMPLHIGKEEQLFIQLAKHVATIDQKFPHLMQEHREEREKVQRIIDALKEGNERKVVTLGEGLVKGLAKHAHDENNNVFPIAEQVLTPDQVAELHKQMRKIGNV